MSLYLVPKCDGCQRLFTARGRPNGYGAEVAMKERLTELGWDTTRGCTFCLECVRNHARGEVLDEPRRLAH